MTLEQSLYCPSHRLHFPKVNGFLQLLSPGAAAEAEAFSKSYRQRRENQGWRSLSGAEMAALPENGPAGWDFLYWPARRQSYQRLMHWVERDRRSGKPLRVIDMGAGMGWLSSRLAADGHEVAALDLSDDAAFGLGAAHRLARFLNLNFTLVQGRMEDPPFRPGQIDLLIYNASLHYADNLEQCLKAGAALLQPGGTLVIMDSPVMDAVVESTWPGGQRLNEKQLSSALANAGLSFKYIPVRRSVRWYLRQFKARLAGQLSFTLPMIIARPA